MDIFRQILYYVAFSEYMNFNTRKNSHNSSLDKEEIEKEILIKSGMVL